MVEVSWTFAEAYFATIRRSRIDFIPFVTRQTSGMFTAFVFYFTRNTFNKRFFYNFFEVFFSTITYSEDYTAERTVHFRITADHDDVLINNGKNNIIIFFSSQKYWTK